MSQRVPNTRTRPYRQCASVAQPPATLSVFVFSHDHRLNSSKSATYRPFLSACEFPTCWWSFACLLSCAACRCQTHRLLRAASARGAASSRGNALRSESSMRTPCRMRQRRWCMRWSGRSHAMRGWDADDGVVVAYARRRPKPRWHRASRVRPGVLFVSSRRERVGAALRPQQDAACTVELESTVLAVSHRRSFARESVSLRRHVTVLRPPDWMAGPPGTTSQVPTRTLWVLQAA